MSMTEQEAKTKWCPFARVADCGADNAVAANRSAAKVVNFRCIASDCMAWRWEPVEDFEERQQAHEDSFNIGGVDAREEPLPKGYCGLAGKVQP